MSNLVYSGIGSRSTSTLGLARIAEYAEKLNKLGYWCRTGAAIGADQQFAKYSKDKTILYLPWSNYEEDFWWDDIESKEKYNIGYETPSYAAVELASKYHPKWSNCSDGARRLHGRNAHIILGRDLKSPSKFVLYTAEEKSGEVQGGTGLGVRLARGYNIPCYNLYITDDIESFLIEQLKE